MCIIPARRNSKSIPLKNIIDLCGKPLIAYTIEIALKLKLKKLLSDFIVSTDCQKIADISKSYGAKIPFLRPKKMAGDKAKSIDYVLHSIDYFKTIGIRFDAVIILQPTSPLKSFEDVKNAILIFNKNNKDSLISAYREDTINQLIMYRKKNNVAIPLSGKHNKGIRRQDHGSIFVRNGAIYITKTKYIKKEKKIVSNKPLIYEMSKMESINIDTHEDLKFVKSILCK